MRYIIDSNTVFMICFFELPSVDPPFCKGKILWPVLGCEEVAVERYYFFL